MLGLGFPDLPPDAGDRKIFLGTAEFGRRHHGNAMSESTCWSFQVFQISVVWGSSIIPGDHQAPRRGWYSFFRLTIECEAGYDEFLPCLGENIDSVKTLLPE